MLIYFSSIDQRMEPGDCQCGTGRSYLVKYLMYVPVPQKVIFFPNNPSEKRLCFSMCEWPNLFSLVKSIFIDHIYFHWSNLFSEIYGVRPSAKRLSKVPIPLKKGFLCQCGSGRINFHWPNLFSLAKSIFTGRIYFVAYMVYVPVPQKLIFFRKIPHLKRLCLLMLEYFSV